MLYARIIGYPEIETTLANKINHSWMCGNG
jgi:hypothetical protein